MIGGLPTLVVYKNLSPFVSVVNLIDEILRSASPALLIERVAVFVEP